MSRSDSSASAATAGSGPVLAAKARSTAVRIRGVRGSALPQTRAAAARALRCTGLSAPAPIIAAIRRTATTVATSASRAPPSGAAAATCSSAGQGKAARAIAKGSGGRVTVPKCGRRGAGRKGAVWMGPAAGAIFR